MWQSATEIEVVQNCFVAEWLMMMMSVSARTTTEEMISRVRSVHIFTSVWCRILTPPEVTSKLHEWMDTFQINPEAICADMAFHILMTCMLSNDCTIQTHFRQDRILLAHIELTWVYDCSRSFSQQSRIQPPKIWTGPLWRGSLLSN